MIRDEAGVWLELPDGGQIVMAPGVLVIAPGSWFWAPADQFESSEADEVLRLEDRASGAVWTYLAPRVRWVTVTVDEAAGIYAARLWDGSQAVYATEPSDDG